MILNILVIKDLSNDVFEYIDPWGETLASISWDNRASCHCTIQVTLGQDVFGRDMIFNLASVVDWQLITTGKQQQVDIDNIQEKYRQVTHDYVISNLEGDRLSQGKC